MPCHDNPVCEGMRVDGSRVVGSGSAAMAATLVPPSVGDTHRRDAVRLRVQPVRQDVGPRLDGDALAPEAVTILSGGTMESFKGAVHATSLGLVAVMLAYNAAAFHARGKRDAHLLFNAFVYGLVAGFEVYQTARHWRS